MRNNGDEGTSEPILEGEMVRLPDAIIKLTIITKSLDPGPQEDDLNQKVTQEIANVKRDPMLIRRAVRDMLRRAHMCINEGGRHIEHLLENK